MFNLPGMLLATMITRAAQNPEVMAQQRAGQAAQVADAEQALAEKKAGDAGALVKRNLTQGLGAKLAFMVITGRRWVTFGLFLLGLAAGRLELFRDDAQHREFPATR